uniref:TMV resistance protein N-like isoform X2 n=1 Tax=Fragaria vesca subsp. vesca TaxID=101020 RepID=UPI0005CA32B7|nr:PREDICTED: TMV resistance protein N-like isoform X2 [Fragaria vesca subsp. vesca]
MDDRDTSGNASYSTLKTTMEDSWFAIVVLSGMYADSTRSLDKLAMICECMNTGQDRIFPVFYQVDPTDVKYQMGGFEEAFTKHENSGLYGSDKLNQWRDALRLVGTLPLSQWQYNKGFSLSVQGIVGSVLRRLPYLLKINTVNNHISFKPTRQATSGIVPTISRETAASLRSSVEPSSKARRWKYDVFFSFRRENRVYNLALSTKRRLQGRGFKTYIGLLRSGAGLNFQPPLLTTLAGRTQSNLMFYFLSGRASSFQP